MAILVGLAIAAALILIPRALIFTPAAEDACAERGAAYVGLHNGSGRYSDPVPEGARCLDPGEFSPVEVEVGWFAEADGLDLLFTWIYRLICVIAPIGIAILIGTRLSRGAGGGSYVSASNV